MPSPELATVRDLRRAQILAEARAIVAEEGLGALTFGTLERRLPFSRGVVTHHFRNKDEIVDAVLDEALADIDAATREDVAASATLRDMLRAVLRTKVHGFLEVVEAAQVLISFWSRLNTDPRARAHNAAMYRRYRHQSAKLLAEGQRQGVFRADLDVDGFAALLVAQVLGITLQALFEPGAIAVDRAIEAATDAVLAGAR